MYKSKKQIEKKFGQSRYIYKQISKFKNRIFVKGGLDEKTGTRPLLTYLSSFLAQTRSVLQYAHKEAQESGKLLDYERCVTTKPIFKFFKDLRNNDIHEYTIGAIVAIAVEAPIDPSKTDPNMLTTERVSFLVEKLSDLDSPKDSNDTVTITTTISKRIQVTSTLLKQLKTEGMGDLFDAAKRGEDLYEQQVFEGESDLFKLCERYLEDLEDFITCGTAKGFIS